jgi:O-antigen biosynthesis protein
MLTSIVILTYNKLDYTKECIESIRKYTEPGTYEIIIIDNNSTDGTKGWLKSQIDIKVIFNSENVGFPKGCNQGIEVARGENILLLNNDVVVTHKWLENMLTCLYSVENVGAVGPVTNSAAYYTAIPVSYKNMNEMHTFARNYNISDQTKWEERLKLIGYCMLIKKEVINQIGLLDEIFTPGNFEDDDYSLRIRKQGFKLFLCKDTFIHHYGSVSWRENIDGYTELLSSNERKFMDKWGTNSSDYIIHSDLLNDISFSKESAINVLHIGCSAGGTLLEIKNRYKNALLFGIEKNKHAAKEANSFAKVICAPIHQGLKEYGEKKFDLIIITDWDNITELKLFVDVIKKRLTTHGILLASVYNSSYFSLINSLINGQNPFHNNTYMSIHDVNEIFQGLKYRISSVPGFLLDEEKKTLDLYCKLSNPSMRIQYESVKYLISATLYSDQLKTYISNVLNEIDVEQSLKLIYQNFSDDEIIEYIINGIGGGVENLQKIAVINYSNNRHDNVLPYLHKAYELDSSNPDTLYNLGVILFSYREIDLAKIYLNSIEEKYRDNEVINILREIDMFEEKKTRELVLLLRKIEFDLNLESIENQLVDYIIDDNYTDQEILEVIKKKIINKEKVLNKVAALSFENGLYNNIFPYLNLAYELNPENDHTLYNLSLILTELGDHGSALRYLNKINYIDSDVSYLLSIVNERVISNV